MVEQFVEPFKKAVESVKPGELVPNLVETQFGYHVIKRDEATKEDIVKAYKQAKSLDLSKKVAAQIAADIKSGKSGDEAVKAAIAQYGILKPAEPKPEPKPAAAAKGDGGADAGAAATADAGATSPRPPSTRPRPIRSARSSTRRARSTAAATRSPRSPARPRRPSPGSRSAARRPAT